MADNTSYKLNIFQKAALSWDRMTPYNAAHVMRVEGPLDRRRLAETLVSSLAHYGLGPLKLDERAMRFSYENASGAPEVEILPRSADTLEKLRARVEEELNKPFSIEPPSWPLRFFAAEEDGRFYLGLVYFHVIADASSIIFLLNDIAGRYRGGTHGTAPPKLYPRVRLTLPALAGGVLSALKALPGDIEDVRRTLRVSWINGAPRRAALLFGRLPLDGAALAEKSRALGVTLNDVFLAALLKSVPPLRGKKKSPHRSRLSVGSIISTRKDLGLNGGREFGLFLSSFRVSAGVPDQYSLAEMAKEVRRQTARVKKGRLYLRNMLETAMGLNLEKLYTAEVRERFYAKHYPLSAGLTNIDLKPLWRKESGELPDYWRAVSTNGAVPMVFSVTSAGRSLNISVSYSTQVYTEEEAREALARFSGYVREFAGP